MLHPKLINLMKPASGGLVDCRVCGCRVLVLVSSLAIGLQVGGPPEHLREPCVGLSL